MEENLEKIQNVINAAHEAYVAALDAVVIGLNESKFELQDTALNEIDNGRFSMPLADACAAIAKGTRPTDASDADLANACDDWKDAYAAWEKAQNATAAAKRKLDELVLMRRKMEGTATPAGR
ncbi:MAG: hypothetical protein LBH53_00950 [Puniceicoccales bacterium]|nr:hypothetical protein [Puniceicoccales bacterium]